MGEKFLGNTLIGGVLARHVLLWSEASQALIFNRRRRGETAGCFVVIDSDNREKYTGHGLDFRGRQFTPPTGIGILSKTASIRVDPLCCFVRAGLGATRFLLLC